MASLRDGLSDVHFGQAAVGLPMAVFVAVEATTKHTPVTDLRVIALAFAGALVGVLGMCMFTRFTMGSKMLLGATLCLAPVFSWWLVRGDMHWAPWWMALALMLWIAGLEVLFLCQSEHFDTLFPKAPASRRPRLRRLALMSHINFLAMLLFLGIAGNLGIGFGFGYGVLVVLICIPHRIAARHTDVRAWPTVFIAQVMGSMLLCFGAYWDVIQVAE
jgi:4-hydroxybenzoate polyprenyltransferase